MLLKTENGTTQIDHIVLLPSGIYVIETKNMGGWIFGDENKSVWTQTFKNHKNSFQNPIYQNYKHVKAVQKVLDIDEIIINNVVVFVGSAIFKTEKPNSVYSLRQFKKLIKSDDVLIGRKLLVEFE